MDAEIQRMWELIGSLSDAFWHRLNQPGLSALDALREEGYRPESDEEKAIWTEITAPHNYSSLRRYIESKERSQITDYAARLYEALLADATHRWETGVRKEGKGEGKKAEGKKRDIGKRAKETGKGKGDRVNSRGPFSG